MSEQVERSWVCELRLMLKIPDEKWFGVVVAFIDDLNAEAYKQGKEDRWIKVSTAGTDAIIRESIGLNPKAEKKEAEEGYSREWKHCLIHLNPETGEIHGDGDLTVREWLLEQINGKH